MEFTEIKVRPLDMKKLIEHINDKKHDFQIHRKFAISTNPPALIDTECCGISNNKVNIDLYPPDKTGEKGQRSFHIFPSHSLDTTIEDLTEFAGPEVLLKDFMGDRYNYNNRLRCNQSEWLDYFNAD